MLRWPQSHWALWRNSSGISRGSGDKQAQWVMDSLSAYKQLAYIIMKVDRYLALHSLWRGQRADIESYRVWMPRKQESWGQKFQSEAWEHWTRISDYDGQTDWLNLLILSRFSLGSAQPTVGKECPQRITAVTILTWAVVIVRKPQDQAYWNFLTQEGLGREGHQTLICDLSHFILNFPASQMPFNPSCVWSHCLGGV